MVVEIVGHPAGQPPEGFHLLGLGQLGLQFFLLGDVLAGTEVADDLARVVPDETVVPGDEPFFAVPGEHGVLEELDRLEVAPQQLFGNGFDHRGDPLGDEVGEPVTSHHLVPVVAQDLATLAVDHGHLAGRVDGHHQDAGQVEVGLGPLLLPVQGLLGLLARGDVLDRAVRLLERPVLVVLDPAVDRGGHDRPVLADHLELHPADDAVLLEAREVPPEMLVIIGKEELGEVVADQLVAVVPQTHAIGVVDVDQVALLVEGLVTHRRLVEERTQAFGAIPQRLVNLPELGQGVFQLLHLLLEFTIPAVDFLHIPHVGHVLAPPGLSLPRPHPPVRHRILDRPPSVTLHGSSEAGAGPPDLT